MAAKVIAQVVEKPLTDLAPNTSNISVLAPKLMRRPTLAASMLLMHAVTFSICPDGTDGRTDDGPQIDRLRLPIDAVFLSHSWKL